MLTSSAAGALAAPFDESFYDVPNQQPAVPIALPVVSVRNQQVLLHVTDELLAGSLPLLCDVDVRVSLSEEQRGIHMSRIQSALQDGAAASLSDHAAAIAGRVRESQRQERVEVRLAARAPLVTHTRVSGLPSPDTVEISAVAVAGRAPRTTQAVAATNMTACPCMQGYSLTDLIRETGLSPQDGVALLTRVPIATHSQRGRVQLSVSAADPVLLPGYHRLHEVLAARTTLTQELLKRPDEYDLVRRAHFRPQFVEDVVRSVASGVRMLDIDGDRLGDLVVEIVAESYESIHGHDILARVEAPAADLVHLG
ncbi:GTP cyclohydrolase, FolE2/MptA family [Phytohabitans aurantiacus]|jgi:GTP cyclohydrolase-4|uniref:GTP cyclohydrolase I FolE2 n=1 Tax=Phytohabitans aurantiacus TaxID=3016789 RepID=A0ABQ5R668_9ACTN|nr:GTP cyclohydrolase, FolE2/MptA family [Phytohabitans aurantiacus]GLI01885.1 GTP cyclohydrolase I FolE2 [Phytohabitans aurantiacus]